MPARTSNVDHAGVEHRPGCRATTWAVRASRVRGWDIHTCTDCGAVRLARGGRR